jgi:hypothetical protein
MASKLNSWLCVEWNGWYSTHWWTKKCITPYIILTYIFF